MKAMAMYGNNASFIAQSTNDGGTDDRMIPYSNEFFPLQLQETISWSDVSLEGLIYDSSRYMWSEKQGKMVPRNDAGLVNADGTMISSENLEARGDVFNLPADLVASDGSKALKAESDARVALNQIPVTYEDQCNELYIALTYIHDNGPDDEGQKNSRMAEKCLYAILNHPLPIPNSELDQLIIDAGKTENVKDGGDEWTREGFVKSKSKQTLKRENPNFFNILI